MSDQKVINKSLVAFSNFVGAAVIFGVIASIVGAIILGSNLSSGNLSSLPWGIILVYLGAGLIGLGIMGAFLRQTARVIVEGMGGNLFEGEEKESANEGMPASFGKLTTGQYNEWINAGQPELTSWDGEASSFDNWLASKK
jgi:hypothetical protein